MSETVLTGHVELSFPSAAPCDRARIAVDLTSRVFSALLPNTMSAIQSRKTIPPHLSPLERERYDLSNNIVTDLVPYLFYPSVVVLGYAALAYLSK